MTAELDSQSRLDWLCLLKSYWPSCPLGERVVFTLDLFSAGLSLELTNSSQLQLHEPRVADMNVRDSSLRTSDHVYCFPEVCPEQ